LTPKEKSIFAGWWSCGDVISANTFLLQGLKIHPSKPLMLMISSCVGIQPDSSGVIQ
jgi:hypothetical protein